MTNFTTLGDMLLRRYIQDFISNMNHLGGLAGNILHMAVPKSVQYQAYGGEKTAGILFREKPWDKWALWKPTEEARTDYVSVLGHQCKRFRKISLMSIHPAQENPETCFACGDPMPEKLVGLWKMQNWDVYTNLYNL